MHLLMLFCFDIVLYSSAHVVKLRQILCQETMPRNPVEALVEFEKAVDRLSLHRTDPVMYCSS